MSDCIDKFDVTMIESKSDAYPEDVLKLPSAQPTLRERALMLLLNWAIECGFGYDNIPEEYARYEDEIKEMGYIDGMVYIAEKEVNRND